MARKLRTGFELPFSNATGSNSSKTYSRNYFNNNIFGGLCNGWVAHSGATKYNSFSSIDLSTETLNISFNTSARTKTNGTRGCVLDGTNGQNKILSLDPSQFTSGFFANFWIYTAVSGNYLNLLNLHDGTNYYSCSVLPSASTIYLGNGSDLDTATVTFTAGTFYNISVTVDNSGNITVTANGVSVTHASGNAWSAWTKMGLGNVSQNAYLMDDLSINDGSGASDNSTPNSIRGYNFFDAATLNTNSGFSAVGGTTVLANLQDGSDSTRVSASADLSYIDFSLPTLSATGMSETAANFTKIEAINVYARQIEATKTSSLLKAKVTDTVAVVDREENLSLPLTVGNDSVTMFDDGSSDWVLANLDSGDMDFRVTFDKP